MKIYINNLNQNNFCNIQSILADIIFDIHSYIEVYTNESIYQIENKCIFLLEPIDRDVIVYKNYFNNITLLLDQSYFKKNIENSVHGNVHCHKNIKKYIYKLNPLSKISFIIETIYNEDNNLFVPNDAYFECKDLIDIKELFIKQDIIEFLSLLN